MEVTIAEHLFEIYPAMPRYANDPEQSEVVRTYDFLLRRFQGFYGRQPRFFAKANATPTLLGDHHSYVGYPQLSLSTSQDVIIAISSSTSGKIRINNYQSAIYGQKTLSSCPGEWKFDEEGDAFGNVLVKLLTLVGEEAGVKDFGGLELMLYSSFVEEQFMGWKEALFAAFYAAVHSVVLPKKPLTHAMVAKALKNAQQIDGDIIARPQLTSSKYGNFTIHDTPIRQLAFPKDLAIVFAHSLTPLPKKLTQGKRFNLRRCQVLIAIQYVKMTAGTTKDIRSLKELQETIGCTTEQLAKEIEESVPSGKITAEQIQTATERSLIDILREVPYANSVIDQNAEFFPRDRALFFLKEQLLLQAITSQNLVETVRSSQRNQSQLLGSGSEQIDRLVEAATPIALAHRVVGSGWGGNVMFLCPKGKSGLLVEELIQKFYLHTDNRVLLSDDLEQYIQAMEQPSTGLSLLDPTSEIWF